MARQLQQWRSGAACLLANYYARSSRVTQLRSSFTVNLLQTVACDGFPCILNDIILRLILDKDLVEVSRWM